MLPPDEGPLSWATPRPEDDVDEKKATWLEVIGALMLAAATFVTYQGAKIWAGGEQTAGQVALVGALCLALQAALPLYWSGRLRSRVRRRTLDRLKAVIAAERNGGRDGQSVRLRGLQGAGVW